MWSWKRSSGRCNSPLASREGNSAINRPVGMDDNCLHTQESPLRGTVTLSVPFAPVSGFLLENAPCWLLWAVDRTQGRGRRSMRASAWGLACPSPGTSLAPPSGPGPAGTPLPPTRTPFRRPLLTASTLYLILTPQEPRAGLGHGSRACPCAGTWPATPLGLPGHLPHSCPVKQCGLMLSPSNGAPPRPSRP